MIGLKKGQGAALTVVSEPTRSPERDALANAIEALEERREHLARAERAKEANGWEARAAIWREKDEAVETLRKLPKLREDYFTAVARGEAAEKPPAEHDLREVIARCDREIADGQELEKAQDKAIEDLRFRIKMAEMTVNDAALDVLRADPVGAELVAECQRAWLRYRFLQQAIGAFTKHQGNLPVDQHRIEAMPKLPACPYREAGEALKTSSHVPISSLTEALARL
jgi:hypothetical protein